MFYAGKVVRAKLVTRSQKPRWVWTAALATLAVMVAGGVEFACIAS